MEKEFDNWNIKKKLIQKRKILFYNECEIWWCNLGINIGCEEDGKGGDYLRPVLILKKYNKYHVLIVPLSSNIKESKYRYNFEINGKEQSALLSQLRTIDTRRLTDKLGKISDKRLSEIKEKINL